MVHDSDRLVERFHLLLGRPPAHPVAQEHRELLPEGRTQVEEVLEEVKPNAGRHGHQERGEVAPVETDELREAEQHPTPANARQDVVIEIERRSEHSRERQPLVPAVPGPIV